jgi:hypothetical protein
LLTVLGFLLGSLGTAQALEISIRTPENGDIVAQREVVFGLVSDPATVWVVVKPMEDNRYWVQPSTNMRNNGKWWVLAHFGQAISEHSGKSFQVRACANPIAGLSEGLIFYTWPQCVAWSNIVTVTRK